MSPFSCCNPLKREAEKIRLKIQNILVCEIMPMINNNSWTLKDFFYCKIHQEALTKPCNTHSSIYSTIKRKITISIIYISYTIKNNLLITIFMHHETYSPLYV